MGKLFIVLIALVIGFVSFPLKISADGMVIPRPDYYIRESGQKAVIFYENGRETLILTITFRGDAKDFGWVIPVPQKPTVTKGSDEIFTSLQEITQKYGYRDRFLFAPLMMGAREVTGPVTVIETKKIDYYEIAVLSATDSQALAKWLSENGYQYPEESAYILQDYINNNWYFVAVKISPEAAGAKEVIEGLKEGHVTPLKLEFNSAAIVYPLRISAIQVGSGIIKLSDNLILDRARIDHLKMIGYKGLTDKEKGPKIFNQIVQDLLDKVEYLESLANQYHLIISQESYSKATCFSFLDCQLTVENWFNDYFFLQGLYYYGYTESGFPIELYVIASHKKEIPGFLIDYANWIGAKEIRKLAYDINGRSLIEPQGKKYYITALSRYISSREINQDLVLRDAENNKRVNAPNPWLNFLWGSLIALGSIFLWLFSPLGLIFIAGLLITVLTKSKVSRSLGRIFQLLSFLITLGFFILFLILALKFSRTFAERIWTVGLTSGLGLILIGQIIIALWQSRFISKKEIS